MPMRVEMPPFRCRAPGRSGQGGEAGAGEEVRRGSRQGGLLERGRSLFPAPGAGWEADGATRRGERITSIEISPLAPPSCPLRWRSMAWPSRSRGFDVTT
jgi:hypothetical protein